MRHRFGVWTPSFVKASWSVCFTPKPVDHRQRNQIVVLEEDRVVEQGTHEALLAQGGVAGSYVFYVQDNELHYLQNYLGLEEFTVTSCVDVPEGECPCVMHSNLRAHLILAMVRAF